MNESLFRSTRVVYNTFVLVNKLKRDRDLSGSFKDVPINWSFGVGSPKARCGSPASVPESTDRGGVPIDLGLASPSEYRHSEPCLRQYEL